MVSLKDIAVVCNVSIATVSKALNNHSDISEETKLHIRAKAKEMGYSPNSVARALKMNKTNNIGVLFAQDVHSGITHDYFSHVLESFKVTAEKEGYDITFINCNRDGKNRMSYLEHSRYRRFDGVMIACMDFEEQEVLELIRSRLPVVTIDHVFDNQIGIVSDNVKGMEELVTYVYEMGHRKIAFIHGIEEVVVTRSRLTAFYRKLHEYGISVPDEYVRSAPYRNVAVTAAETDILLDLPDPPTCIFYPDDFAAYGGINAIRARKLSVPEDISVVGYDGITLAKLIEPKMTTYAQDTREIGKRAAEELISLIEKPKLTLRGQVMVSGTLIKGETVKKLI